MHLVKIYLSLFGIVMGTLSCSVNLERPGVEVWMGLTVDKHCSASNVIQDTTLNREYGISGWLFEFPFFIAEPDRESTFRYYETHLLDTLLPVLQADSIPYGLAFDLQNPKDFSTTYTRIDEYLTDVSGILLRTKDYAPDHIIFMGEFIHPEIRNTALQNFVDQLREELYQFDGSVIYAAKSEDLIGDFDWDTPDKVGIIFQPPPDEMYKPYFRQINRRISDSLIAHNKSAMIVRSNLMGEDKALQLRNQLRFWSEEVDIESIVLNTVYCQFSLSDTAGYFSASKDRELQRFLKEYSP